MNKIKAETARRSPLARTGAALSLVLLMTVAAPAQSGASELVPSAPSPSASALVAPNPATTSLPAASAAPTVQGSDPTIPTPQASDAIKLPGANPLTAEAMKAAMRKAIPSGGAEMGQRSPRVMANKQEESLHVVAGSRAVAGPIPLVISQATDPGHWSPPYGVAGQDVSAYQGNVDWAAQWNQGSRFAYVKASEGNYYLNENFAQQYNGSRSAGMIRGAYHFAIPNWSSGADQAKYFVANGGGWSADGYTLPPVLDIEYNPYEGQTINGFYFGNTCYGMSAGQMASWISDFGNTVKSLIGRYPVIYSTTDWWATCTGNSGGFANYPLWIASYPSSPSSSPGTLPASWNQFSMWQYSSTGPFAGDSNIWNGSLGDLNSFARNGVPDSASNAINALSASMPSLGGQTSWIMCGLRDGGCYQNYQNGAITWSASTGAQPSPAGPIRTAWQQSGFENGVLGYPQSGLICGLKDGGCYQAFQYGAIIWSAASGAQLSRNGPIRATWQTSGFETGPLGYPTSDQICGLVSGGCYQNFQSGAILWSPATGAFISLNGPIRSAWQQTGFESGPLGYPTSNPLCGLRDGGCFQSFQTGSVVSAGASGTHIVRGEMALAWRASGRESGPLGYPTAEEVCGLVNGGCYQNFEKGATIWSPASGAFLSINDPIRTAWQQQGFEKGALGYPTNSETCGLLNGGCYQNFQGGAIIWSSTTGAQVSTADAIRGAWSKSGFENGPLGYPTGAETCGLPNNGCYQNFQNGTISWTPAQGAFSVLGPILTKWIGLNRETGPLGFPIGVQTCGLSDGGCYQNFQNGAMLWSANTDAQPSFSGPIRSSWQASGFENGPLGYPVVGETCGIAENGCYQDFQKGTLIWTPARGAFMVIAPIYASWNAANRQSGALGFPTSSQVCGLQDGGCYQNFQNGAILWSPATGSQISPTGPIRTAWGSTGFERGGLGYPTSGVVCGLRDGGCYQNFQGGAILWSPTTGARPSVGQIRLRYATLGFENSFLGYPVTGDICTLANGGCYQNYQRGSITWYPATGTSVSSVPR